MKFSRVFASSLLVASAVAMPLQAGQFTEIVAFGDSLTDTGNLYAATQGAFPPAPYYQGRFSNGPVWVEWLALQLGVPAPTPSLKGGTNYAFAGAETALTGFSTQGTPNIGPQIDSYLSAHHTFGANQLVVLWAGANDFLNAGQTDPSVPVAHLSDAIVKLAKAGATTIVVPNLPPLGKTPIFVGTAYEAGLNALTSQFNDLLDAKLDDLEANLGITFIRFNIADLFQRFLQHPQSFGFTDVTHPALITANGDVGGPPVSVAPNPDNYVFWDIIHPTRVAHREIGDLRNQIRYGAIRGDRLKWTPIPAALAKGR
jgi:phospholipase/lecithinase/hemolysin